MKARIQNKRSKEFLVLGIETSCDETSVSLVSDGRFIRGVKTYSQIKEHSRYGGVVPEIAGRIHVKVIHHLLNDLTHETGHSLKDIDLIGVTNAPGLIGSLLTGVSFANGLAWCLGIPVIPVNHVEAHIYAAFMDSKKTPSFPCLALVVSGGHTMLIQAERIGKYRKLGATIDDAVGEAFDKIAKILGLPYPGGPAIERCAKEGNPNAYRFPRAMLHDRFNLNFSFSGLKTSVLYEVRGFGGKNKNARLSQKKTSDIAASAQRAMVDVLVHKTSRAAETAKPSSIIVCGGVAANSELKKAMTEYGKKSGIEVLIPPINLCTDNAVMVAGLAYHKRKQARRWISKVAASGSGQSIL